MTTTPDQSGLVVQRGTSFIAVAIVQSVAGAMFLPLLARTLDAAELGVVAAAQVVTLLTVIVVSLGLPNAVTREYFHEDGPERSSRIMGLLMISAPVLVLLVHVAGPLWSRVFDGISYTATLQIAVWTAFPRAVIFGGMARMRAELKSVPFGVVGISTAVGSQAVGLLLLQQQPDVVRYVAGVGAVHAVLACIVVCLVRPRFDRLRELAPPTLRYALPVAMHSSAGLVVAMGDRVVIEQVLGLGDVGRYQIAYAVGSIVILALLALNNAWGPLVLGAPAGEQRIILAATTRAFVRLSSALMVGLAAIAPFALRLVAPASYRPEELVRTTIILAFTAVPMVFYLAGNHLALLERRTVRLALATATGAVVNVVGNLALIGPLGLEGAAIATVLSYVTWAVVLHASPDSRSMSWGFAQVSRIIGVAGCAMVLLLLVPDGRPAVMVSTVVAVGAGVVFLLEVRRLFGSSTDDVAVDVEPWPLQRQ